MMMHLVWTRHGRPLEVPTIVLVLVLVLAEHAGHPHYLLAEQPVADWQHLREGHELLVLLQELRQVLAAYVRRPGGGPDLRRHGPPGGEARVGAVQAVHGGVAAGAATNREGTGGRR